MFRAAISFATGLLVARGLGPAGYGDLNFLLGSFVAVQTLVNMGSSNAFFTLISQRARGGLFYLTYFGWMGLQFAATLLVVAIVIPAEIFERIWLGHSRGMVILALLAAFMQQQVWQVVVQIGESARKTAHVQLLNIGVAIAYLAAVYLISVADGISVASMLKLLIVQYLLAALVAYRLLHPRKSETVETVASVKNIVDEFWKYCKPLIGFYIAGFLYAFTSNWMLQRFGGASEQGYFQIASQFASISLLATTSILNIFWKEIAEAAAKADRARVASLYRKVNRGLVMLNATIAGFLLPWSKQIVALLLGPAYTEAWPILAIMFLYPIHQSMGQIGGAMFLAQGDTRRFTVLSIAILLSICTPITYFALAPTSGIYIPGFGLGGIGMAGSTVLANFLGVIVQGWFIAGSGGWKFDWLYQAVGIPLIIGLGYSAKMLVGLLWNLEGVGMAHMVGPVFVASIFYIMFVLSSLWLLPWLIGMDRDEIRGLLRFRNISARRTD